jgi:hypothetical protein
MAPTLTLLRKTMLRGRGPQRIRALIGVTVDAQHTVVYTQTFGFADAAGSPNNGIDIQSILTEPIQNVVGCMIEPRMTLLSSWTNFVTGLSGTHGILDYATLTVSNYTTLYKRLYVKLFGVTDTPGIEEADTDVTIDAGSFAVELEFTSISGAEG